MLVYAITPEIEDMTRRNVNRLLANTTGEFELRILINGGPVMSFPADDRLVPIYMEKRLGMAAAYNLAFSCARGDVYACVHNDVAVPFAWNEALEDAGGIAFPMVVEDADDCAERGVKPTMPTFPPGCCFMFSKAIFESLGGFDEVFEDCHFEDTDFWMRALDKAIPLHRVNVTVEHGRAKTRTSLPDMGNVAFHRNKQLYIERYAQTDGSVPLPTLQEQPC